MLLRTQSVAPIGEVSSTFSMSVAVTAPITLRASEGTASSVVLWPMDRCRFFLKVLRSGHAQILGRRERDPKKTASQLLGMKRHKLVYSTCVAGILFPGSY